MKIEDMKPGHWYERKIGRLWAQKIYYIKLPSDCYYELTIGRRCGRNNGTVLVETESKYISSYLKDFYEIEPFCDIPDLDEILRIYPKTNSISFVFG